MLRKLRIEVEEESPDKCVETLTKYEHALMAQEVKRYRKYFPVSSDDPELYERILNTLDHPWEDEVAKRNFFNGELGREVVEEVIEYDPSLPGYKGRRVVSFTRIDTRSPEFGPLISGTISTGNPSSNPNHWTFFPMEHHRTIE